MITAMRGNPPFISHLVQNALKKRVSIFAIIYCIYLLFHILFYIKSNCLCRGWKTGFIHDTPSAGAGALPPIYISNIATPQELNPLKPFYSYENAFSLIIICISLSFLLVYTFSIIRYKNIKSFDSLFALVSMLILTVCVSNMENYISCRLERTHINIQSIFEILNLNKGRTNWQDQELYKYDTISNNIYTDEYVSIYEIYSHYGEATCNAYVAIIKNNDDIPPATAEEYPAWFTLSNANGSSLIRLLSSIDVLNKKVSAKYLNAKQFYYPDKAENGSRYNKYYSIIACVKWPHGWLY